MTERTITSVTRAILAFRYLKIFRLVRVVKLEILLVRVRTVPFIPYSYLIKSAMI
jgi:hypothetical protein